VSDSSPVKGRGAVSNPGNRFEKLELERDPEWNPEEDPALKTEFLRDATATIITYNNSPDVGFDASINPYRGCEHGCIYCFARPTHEYLGLSAGLDFESKILVKERAPELLRNELAAPKWKPQVLAVSGVTDCYQPIERKLQITRGCLQVLAEFRNPIIIVTKNHLVTRDIDVLQELAKYDAAAVFISITTLDPALTPRLEPRASLPKHRLAAVKQLHNAGIQVGVLVAPVIPAITDHELPHILQAAAEAGAQYAGYVPLRLPFGVKDLFAEWLTKHFPERKEKVLNQIRSIRGGKLNDPNYGTRMQGEGIFAEQIDRLFCAGCRKAGLEEKSPRLSVSAFRVPASSYPNNQSMFPF
jgi:DNA repair photolyase